MPIWTPRCSNELPPGTHAGQYRERHRQPSRGSRRGAGARRLPRRAPGLLWVCTLIEESEELTCQAAETTYEELQLALAELPVGLIMGRMKPAEKAAVMADSRPQPAIAGGHHGDRGGGGRAQCQSDDHRESRAPGSRPSCTSCARVGRGQRRQPLRAAVPSAAVADRRERLAIMRETNDGFIIAEKDLELRRPGRDAGTRQTGLLQSRWPI